MEAGKRWLTIFVTICCAALLALSIWARGPFIVVDTLVSGSTWSLMAIGLSLVFGVMNVLNFAQGAFFMVGTLVAYVVFSHLTQVTVLSAGAPILALVAALVVGGALGLFLDVFALRLLRSRSEEQWVVQSFVVTLGAAIILQGIHQLIWGPNYKAIGHYWGGEPITIFHARITRDELMTVAVGAITIATLSTVLRLTRFGRAVRAVAQDERGAAICGIDVPKIRATTLTLGCGLAALAGAALLFRYPSSPTVGEAPLGIAFTVVVLAGLGSITGAILGGLVVALLQTLTDSFLGATWESVITFSVLVAVLLVRPQGIFGRRLAGVWER